MSPSGLSFIGKLTTGERLLSVQRIILDEKIAYAAESAGATLLDGFTVKVRSLRDCSHHGSFRVCRACRACVFLCVRVHVHVVREVEPGGRALDHRARHHGHARRELYASHSLNWSEQADPRLTWPLLSLSQRAPRTDVYRARALVACDGAKSEIARQLGVINSPPNTFCCRSFAKVSSLSHSISRHDTTNDTRHAHSLLTI